MNQQTDEYFRKLERVLKPRVDAIDNYESPKVAEVFALANTSIVHFYFSMSQTNEGKEILHDMFGKASETQLDDAHRLLIFWFLWQHDWAHGLDFLKSEKIRDGLKKIWSFNEAEINYLVQSFDSIKESGMETLSLWKALQSILKNNKWSPLFVFPALSTSLKAHWTLLDSSVAMSAQGESLPRVAPIPIETTTHESVTEGSSNNLAKTAPESLPPTDMPMQWFKFYAYISIPLGLLISLILIFTLSGFAGWITFVNIILLGALFYGLYHRKLWAWYLNFPILIIEGFSKAFNTTRRGAVDYDFTDGVGWVIFIVVTLVWVIPNWIYFAKRKHLFV